MNKVFLLIGGNIGNREQYLYDATVLIGEHGNILIASSRYETAPWGLEDQEAFLNQVLLIETRLPALDLLQTILAIEENLGRIRTKKFGPRTIDIDILFFNDHIINAPNLKVPHPALHERRFALTPLVEITPDYIHPVFRKTMKELLMECWDELEVKKYESD